MLSRIEKLGFNNGDMKPHIMGNMFKTYIRPVVMYGVELFELTKEQTDKICKLESLILKRMIGIKQRCYSRHILNSLRIGLPRRYINKMKLKYAMKLEENDYTKTILNEWTEINPKNIFNTRLDPIMNDIQGVHLNGDPFNLREKCEIKIATLDELNAENQKNDLTAKKLKRIYVVKDKRRMCEEIEKLVHAKNAPHLLV